MKHVKNLFANPRLVVVTTLAVLLIIAYLAVPKFIIGSGSMAPTLPIGTIVVLEPANDLTPTDIITYQQEGDARPTTHTFIGYAEDGSLMTKGDANPTPDVHNPPLMMEDVKGEMAFAILPRSLIISFILAIVGILLVPGRRSSQAEAEEAQSPSSDAPRASIPA